MWNSDIPLPRRPRWQGIKVSIHVVAADGISYRFYPHPLIKTSAILSLDEDATLNTNEIDFAFTVWQSFPDRIVGYPARSHYWDDSKVRLDIYLFIRRCVVLEDDRLHFGGYIILKFHQMSRRFNKKLIILISSLLTFPSILKLS